MRNLLSKWTLWLWRWLQPPRALSKKYTIRTGEYADTTRQERYLFYQSLVLQPGFQLLMDELDYHKSIWERKSENLSSSITDSTPADLVKSQLIGIREATFWLGWIEHKVTQATNYKFPEPTSSGPKMTDAPGLRGKI